LRQHKDRHFLLVYSGDEEVTMEHPQLTATLTVAEVMDRWPQTVFIFLRHRRACVGCPITPFETLAEVAVIYDLDLDCFLNELRQTISQRGGKHKTRIDSRLDDV
jgi:hybrid cluster-associated redox disulfide protein